MQMMRFLVDDFGWDTAKRCMAQSPVRARLPLHVTGSGSCWTPSLCPVATWSVGLLPVATGDGASTEALGDGLVRLWVPCVSASC